MSNSSDGRRPSCKECRKSYTKKYIRNNKKKISENSKLYYLKNKKKIKKASALWKKNNKERYKELHNKRRRERIKSDPLYKLKRILRGRTRHAFKKVGWEKGNSKKLLGADWIIVKNHLESTFTEGMTWENHGKWHIDHIKPLASANNKKELIILCHYTNLQALWAFDNISKGSKIL